jgi:hypothetical protein
VDSILSKISDNEFTNVFDVVDVDDDGDDIFFELLVISFPVHVSSTWPIQ